MTIRTQHESAIYRATLEHESAHLAAAIHVRASVHEVEIRPPRTTRDYLGGINAAAVTAWSDAVISLAGAVWSKMHPTDGVPEQLQDMRDAEAHAREAGCEFADVRLYVEAFLRHQEQNVRVLADRIAYDLPQSGIMNPLKLKHIVGDFAQRIPRLEHSTMLGWGYPMTAVVRYDRGSTHDEGRVAAL